MSHPWAFSMADCVLYNGRKSSVLNDNYSKPRNRLEVLQAYGEHADAEEREWDAIKVRRPLLKAITHLFAGEPNARKYRVALDDLASRRTSHRSQDEPRLSELILNVALKCFDQDVLLRTPMESNEKMVMEKGVG